jgi:hypothetical protein
MTRHQQLPHTPPRAANASLFGKRTTEIDFTFPVRLTCVLHVAPQFSSNSSTRFTSQHASLLCAFLTCLCAFHGFGWPNLSTRSTKFQVYLTSLVNDLIHGVRPRPSGFRPFEPATQIGPINDPLHWVQLEPLIGFSSLQRPNKKHTINDPNSAQASATHD